MKQVNIIIGRFQPITKGHMKCIEMMYKDMYWASEGFLWEMVRKGQFDMAEMEKGFRRLMDFWQSIYLRK